MEIIDYIRAIRRYWPRVVIPTVIAAVLGVALTLVLPKTYSSESDVLVRLSASPGSVMEASAYLTAATPNFVVLATSPTVLNPVINEVGLQTTPAKLAKKVTATQRAGTTIVAITANAGSADQARDIAAGIALELSKQISSMGPSASTSTTTSAAGIRFVPVTITPAQVPTSPSAPSLPVYLITGLIVGLVTGSALAISRYSRRGTVTVPENHGAELAGSTVLRRAADGVA